MKTSFNIGLVEVESWTIQKNNIGDNILLILVCFHPNLHV